MVQIFEVLEVRKYPYFLTVEVEEGEIVADVINNMNSGKVYLIVDHDTKRIWTYNGQNSSFKCQIYGGILAGMLRKLLKLFYRVYPLNMYSTEDPKFQEVMEQPIGPGKAKAIEKRDFSKSTTQRTFENVIIHNPRLSKAMENINFFSTPEDFKRIFLIIAGTIYSDEEGSENIVKMGRLNNGFTMFDDRNYSTRVVIKNRSVQGIELFVQDYDKMSVVQIKYPIIHEDKMSKEENIATRQSLTKKVYQFNDKFGDFEVQMIDPDVQLKDLLDDDFILLFVDPLHFRVWLWHGYNTTTRMKFIAAKMAPAIRDKYGIAFKITAVDQDNEPQGFLSMIGLAEEIDSSADILKALTQEVTHVNFDEIMHKLEEIKIPDGFERELIIIGDHAYSVVERVLTFLCKKRVSKEISRVGAIPEGVFFAEDYSPRVLSENGKILAIEFLKRKGDKPMRDRDDRDRSPYPYIFTHPRPPDDFAPAAQVQVRTPLKEKIPENDVYCLYCEKKLTEDEQITHSCKKKPE